MRPVDLIIIGMLFGVIGRVEQLRDGDKAYSALICNFVGVTLGLAGWFWFLY